MKILLINPPGWQKGSTNLGLCYLAGNLLAHKYNVKILDVNATDEPPEAIAEKVLEYAPDIIGFSIKTATAKAAFLISKVIKRFYGNAVHVIGGPHVTLAYKEVLLENPEIEYAFLGESDLSFVDFVGRLEEKRPTDEVAGIAFRTGDDIVATRREYIEDLDSLPYPNLEVIENFGFDGFRYPMITSRGCPYPCTYCCVGIVSSKKWRARKSENILEELKYVKERFGLDMFEILDDNFTLKVERAKEFCRLLIESKLNMSWYCHNGIRADKIDLELAKLMKQAGCTSVAIGIETGDEKLFDSIKKGEKLEAIVRAVNLIKKAGMRAVGYFIIGLPGDSLEGIKKTIKFQQELGLDDFTYGILCPYPHTEVYDIIKREGNMLMDIKNSSHFSDKPTITFEMPGFSRNEMEKAYYLTKFWSLYKILESYEGKYGRKPKRILYVDFSHSSKFIENLGKILDDFELDIFTAQWSNNNYLSKKESGLITNLYIYNTSPYALTKVKTFLKIFRLFKKRDYSIIFYNIATPKLPLPALLLMAWPKMFFFEDIDGANPISIFDKKIFRFIIRFISSMAGKVLTRLPRLAASLMAYLLFRMLSIGFGLFLYLKRGGKKVDFTSQGPKLIDLNEKMKS